MKEATPRAPAPPVSSTQLIERLAALAARPKPPTTAAVLKAARARDVSPWYEADLPRYLEWLERLDPSWTARLGLMSRPRQLGGDFGARIVQAIARASRQAAGYPDVHDRTPAEVETALGAWAASALRREPVPLPAPLVVAALWPDRRAAWFKDLVIVVIRSWAQPPRTSRDEVLAAMLRDLVVDRTGRKRASEVALLLAQLADRRDLAIAEAQQQTQAAATARDARMRSESTHAAERSALETRIRELELALEGAGAAREALLADVDRANQTAMADRTRAANRIGQLRTQVTRVLAHEIEQMRLFLDRSAPNVTDALARLKYLDDLRVELLRQREET